MSDSNQAKLNDDVTDPSDDGSETKLNDDIPDHQMMVNRIHMQMVWTFYFCNCFWLRW